MKIEKNFTDWEDKYIDMRVRVPWSIGASAKSASVVVRQSSVVVTRIKFDWAMPNTERKRRECKKMERKEEERDKNTAHT